MMPFQRSSRWMAKAGFVVKELLEDAGRRKTAWPAKTADCGNSLATDSQRLLAVSTMSVPRSKR